MHSSPHSSSRQSIIDLVPAAAQRSVVGFLLGLLRTATWLVVAVVLGLVLLRFAGAFWLAAEFSDAVERSAAAGGWDASLTAWLKGVAAVGFGFGAVGLLARALLGWLVPFGSAAAGSWLPMLALMAASGLGTLTPVVIQKARGLGPDNLPTAMTQVDPATSTWFAPGGEALIFSADHLDGERRFWNRPGHTPEDSTLAVPVTSQTRVEWLREKLQEEQEAAARSQAQREQEQLEQRQQAERARQAQQEAEQQRQRLTAEKELAAAKLALEQAQAQRAQMEREKIALEQQRLEAQRLLQQEHARAQQTPATPPPSSSLGFRARLAETPATAPVPPRAQVVEEYPIHRYQLLPGLNFDLGVHGDAVEIWSDGPVAAAADQGGFQTLLPAGRRLNFRHGTGSIHVRPLHPAATTVFVRKLD